MATFTPNGHMNLKMGGCADMVKALYRFAPSEFVAENI